MDKVYDSHFVTVKDHYRGDNIYRYCAYLESDGAAIVLDFEGLTYEK